MPPAAAVLGVSVWDYDSFRAHILGIMPHAVAYVAIVIDTAATGDIDIASWMQHMVYN